jgi:hypothetical protein
MATALAMEAIAWRTRARRDGARIEELEDVLRDIARLRIMDSLTAIHMRALAIGALHEDVRRA